MHLRLSSTCNGANRLVYCLDLSGQKSCMFRQITPTRSYEHVALQIEQNIRSGELAIGARIPSERELARQFGVSRVVVREAMRHLEAQGVIEVRHGSGTYVRMVPVRTLSQNLTLLIDLEQATFADLIIVRQSLERTSARLAAQHATTQDKRALEECLHEMEVAAASGLHDRRSYEGYGALDTRLHLLIAEASHNTPLRTLIGAVVPMVMRGRFDLLEQMDGLQTFLEHRDAARVHAYHVSVVGAIRRGDAAAAEQSMHDQLDFALKVYGDPAYGGAPLNSAAWRR